jgi:hypothetical protein
MRNENKFTLETSDAVKFHTNVTRHFADEPATVHTWAYEPGGDTVILWMSADQAETWGAKMLQAAREARQVEKEGTRT